MALVRVGESAWHSSALLPTGPGTWLHDLTVVFEDVLRLRRSRYSRYPLLLGMVELELTYSRVETRPTAANSAQRGRRGVPNL